MNTAGWTVSLRITFNCNSQYSFHALQIDKISWYRYYIEIRKEITIRRNRKLLLNLQINVKLQAEKKDGK